MFFLAAHFRAARAMLDASQAEIAASAGISLPTLKRLESESSGPGRANSSNVQALAKVYSEKGIRFQFPDRDGLIGVALAKTDDLSS